jgi:hypothetical protein
MTVKQGITKAGQLSTPQLNNVLIPVYQRANTRQSEKISLLTCMGKQRVLRLKCGEWLRHLIRHLKDGCTGTVLDKGKPVVRRGRKAMGS